jgi:hypothetical protein
VKPGLKNKFELFRIVKPAYVLFILLALISQRIIYNEVLYPDLDRNMSVHKLIVQGKSEPPFQYRVLKPVIVESFNIALTPVIKNEISRFKIIYKTMLFTGFFFLYLIFYFFLNNFYSELTSIIGIMMLQISIPLTMMNSNCLEEGDCITAFFYVLAFYAMFKNKDYYVPFIIALGTFNREQTVFIVVFYICYLWDQKILFKKRSYEVIAFSLLAYFTVFFGIRYYFGFMESRFTSELHMYINSKGIVSIIRLWSEQVLIFIICCIAVYNKSRRFFKLAVVSLIPYAAFFFFFGVMGELGKFLPALIILITMSLQMIKGEYTGAENYKFLRVPD